MLNHRLRVRTTTQFPFLLIGSQRGTCVFICFRGGTKSTKELCQIPFFILSKSCDGLHSRQVLRSVAKHRERKQFVTRLHYWTSSFASLCAMSLQCVCLVARWVVDTPVYSLKMKSCIALYIGQHFFPIDEPANRCAAA